MIKEKTLLDVKKCIYCGETSDLTKEHIIPLGLNGVYLLKNASCLSCNSVTTRFERDVLRRMLFYFRAYKERYRTRRPNERPTEIYVKVIDYFSKEKRIKIDISDYGAVAFFPDFKEPEFLSGEENKTVGIQQIRLGGIPLTSLRDKYKIRELCMEVTYRPVDFARMLAKVAYGFTVASFGLKELEEVYCLDSILGNKREIGKWVGKSKNYKCSKKVDFELNLFIGRDRNVFAVIRIMGKSDTPSYKVIVGKIERKVLFLRFKAFLSWAFGVPYNTWILNDESWNTFKDYELKRVEGDFFLHDHNQKKTIKLDRENK